MAPKRPPRGQPDPGGGDAAAAEPAARPPRESAEAGDSPPPAATTFNILFLCTGNTCRSPMAEVIARDELARRGWSHVRVASAGVAARRGAPASAEAREVVRRHGLSLAQHESQPLTSALVDWADLILTMGPAHLAPLMGGAGAERAAVLGDFAGSDERGVSDPFGGPVAVYERTFQELRDLIGSALDRLAPILAP